MKKVLLIILCLLVGCSDPNEKYKEITKNIEDEGYSIFTNDSGLSVSKTDIDGSKSYFMVETDGNKLLYQFHGTNLNINIYDTDQGLLGSAYDDYMTYCSYSLTDGISFDGYCDDEWVEVLETAETLKQTYLNGMSLSDQEFVEWANWYMENATE